MPRNSRNPIEARGRIANFRAKPIAVINVAKDIHGFTPNRLASKIQFYIGAQQVKKDYDTRVAVEWYLDKIFIPEYIKRMLKYGSPVGATTSKDLIRNYPKPVQDKMLEESLDEFIKLDGLPQVFPVEAPFSFDGCLIVPGDIAVGYTGLVRVKKPVGYYDMPTEEQISDAVSHFGKVVFFRYDWMISDEELEKRYKLKSEDKLYPLVEDKVQGFAGDVIDIIEKVRKEKSQSELYESRKDKCVELSEQLFTDHPFFYNPLAYVSVVDVNRSLRDILNVVAPIEAIPYLRKGTPINAFGQYIYSFLRFGIHLHSTLHPKLENEDRYVFQIPRFGGTTEKEQLRDEIDRIFDKLYIRLVTPVSGVPQPWNLGSVEVSDECDIRGRWNGYRLSILDGGNGVESGYRVPDYSLVIATDEEIRLDWVYDRVRNVLDSKWDLPPMIVVFPAGKSKEIQFSAEK